MPRRTQTQHPLRAELRDLQRELGAKRERKINNNRSLDPSGSSVRVAPSQNCVRRSPANEPAAEVFITRSDTRTAILRPSVPSSARTTGCSCGQDGAVNLLLLL